jgi:hypothetical protein
VNVKLTVFWDVTPYRPRDAKIARHHSPVDLLPSYKVTSNFWLRSRRRWEDNIKLGVQEVGWGGMDWIDLARGKDRWWGLVNAVMNRWVFIKCRLFLE